MNIQTHSILQGGPLPVINGVITPKKKSYNPSYPFVRPFVEVITAFMTGRGPPCTSKQVECLSQEKQKTLGILPKSWLVDFGIPGKNFIMSKTLG